MKIQMPDGKQEDEPNINIEHTTLVCEEKTTGNNTGINKLICCSLFGMMYTIAMLTVDDIMMQYFSSLHYLDRTPYTLRMVLCCVMLFICMYGAMSVLIQKSMTPEKFVSTMLTAEGLRIFSYSWDYMSFLTTNIDLDVIVLMVRSCMELALAGMFYYKVVAPAQAQALAAAQAQALATAAAAPAAATPPPAAQAAPSLSVEITGAEPSEKPSLPPGSIAHM